MKRTLTVLKRWLIVSVAASILATGVPNSSNVSGVFAADSIVFSTEQVDSLITLFDDQTLEIRLLRIDNRELEQVARVDSVLAAQLLALQKEHYERMLEAYKKDRDHWIVKSLKSPALWFIIGAYAGLRVSHLAP